MYQHHYFPYISITHYFFGCETLKRARKRFLVPISPFFFPGVKIIWTNIFFTFLWFITPIFFQVHFCYFFQGLKIWFKGEISAKFSLVGILFSRKLFVHVFLTSNIYMHWVKDRLHPPPPNFNLFPGFVGLCSIGVLVVRRKVSLMVFSFFVNNIINNFA